MRIHRCDIRCGCLDLPAVRVLSRVILSWSGPRDSVTAALFGCSPPSRGQVPFLRVSRIGSRGAQRSRSDAVGALDAAGGPAEDLLCPDGGFGRGRPSLYCNCLMWIPGPVVSCGSPILEVVGPVGSTVGSGQPGLPRRSSCDDARSHDDLLGGPGSLCPSRGGAAQSFEAVRRRDSAI